MKIGKKVIVSSLCLLFSTVINAKSIAYQDIGAPTPDAKKQSDTLKYAKEAIAKKTQIENTPTHPDNIKKKLLERQQFSGLDINVNMLTNKLYVIYVQQTKELMYTDADAEIIFTGDAYDLSGQIYVSELIRLDYAAKEQRKQFVKNKQLLVGNEPLSTTTKALPDLSNQAIAPPQKEAVQVSVPKLLKSPESPTTKKSLGTNDKMTIEQISSLPPASLAVSSVDFKRRCLSYAIANAANINQLIGVLNEMPDDSRRKCGLVMSETYAPNLKDERLIVYKAKGEEKDILTVYHDPTCSYCKKLHDEKDELNEMGITVRVYMYGRHAYSRSAIDYDNIDYSKFTTTAKAMSQAVCAKTNTERMQINDSMMAGGKSAMAKIAMMPSPPQECMVRVVAMKNFGDILTGVSTPLSVSTNKKLAISGYRTAPQMARILEL